MTTIRVELGFYLRFDLFFLLISDMTESYLGMETKCAAGKYPSFKAHWCCQLSLWGLFLVGDDKQKISIFYLSCISWMFACFHQLFSPSGPSLTVFESLWHQNYRKYFISVHINLDLVSAQNLFLIPNSVLERTKFKQPKTDRRTHNTERIADMSM